MDSLTPLIRVIGKANGAGLSRDLELIAAALRKCGPRVEVVEAGRHDARLRRSRVRRWCAWAQALIAGSSPERCDLNVMLEHAWPHHMSAARLNVLVPNPEWCDRRDQRHLADFDRIWAKTHSTLRVFDALGLPTAFIGFDSEDRYDVTVEREQGYLHVAGKSKMKGTARLIEVWRRHPEWPRLTVVQNSLSVAHPGTMPGNVEFRRDYLDDQELRRLQNACQFHICMSEAEGWGHYIAEAMSVGAVIVTVDAPPMNELVTVERGLLVAWSGQGRQNLSSTYEFDTAAFENAMARALGLGGSERLALGNAARQWMVDNKATFSGRLRSALNTLGVG